MFFQSRNDSLAFQEIPLGLSLTLRLHATRPLAMSHQGVLDLANSRVESSHPPLNLSSGTFFGESDVEGRSPRHW